MTREFCSNYESFPSKHLRTQTSDNAPSCTFRHTSHESTSLSSVVEVERGQLNQLVEEKMGCIAAKLCRLREGNIKDKLKMMASMSR